MATGVCSRRITQAGEVEGLSVGNQTLEVVGLDRSPGADTLTLPVRLNSSDAGEWAQHRASFPRNPVVPWDCPFWLYSSPTLE